MNFWTGFTIGMLVMGLITLISTTTPDQAAQNLRDWWQVITFKRISL